MMTEGFVAANYAFAVIFITTQVILLNGLASVIYPLILPIHELLTY